MQAIKSFSDIRIGHVLKALLAVLTTLFVFFCMWMGEMVVCLLFVHLFHLKYDALPSPALNEFAGNFLLIVLPFVGSTPIGALIWEQFYPKKIANEI